uniref:VWFA domain-containing protein n=1 Tax=Ciona savignyi TaxID=51511 RepID=H2ZJE6_CIOSA
MSKPITPRFQTNETTPVYLKMKEFMKSVVTGWRSVADDKSRVGVQLFSEACSLTTDYNLNLVKRIGDSNNDTASYIESIDYLCGDPWLDWALRCTDRKVLTSSAGDRPGIPNVIVALVSAIPRSFRPTNFLLSRLSSNIKRKGSTIIAVSATPPSQMSALSRQKHEEMMRTLSCQRSSGHCPTYIGSIWDGGSPAQRI